MLGPFGEVTPLSQPNQLVIRDTVQPEGDQADR